LFVVLFPFAIELILEEKTARVLRKPSAKPKQTKNVSFPHFLEAGLSKIDRLANMHAAL
jgi:hypothetical protein